MTIDCTGVPKWLQTMRAITGVTEEPGAADNPKILEMRNWIACTYSDMEKYCEGYDHDDVPWCGLTAAFCMTVAGIRPPFGTTDTDRWLWALAWADDPNFELLEKPVLGCVVVLEREGGGHVTFYESTSGSNFKCRGGNQSDAINVSSYPQSDVVALVWPKGVPLPAPGPGPEPERETIEEGSVGPDVEEVQRILELPVDGEFGEQTDSGVKGFQAAMDLTVDGAVGSMTWSELDKFDAKMLSGSDRLDTELADQIVRLAKNSEIAEYDWEDRGRPPPGYIPGMALCFALAAQHLDSGPVRVMAQADRQDVDTDVLSYYKTEFKALGMNNSKSGIDTLRHLFDLMIGLGMMESSGDHWCGRDYNAENTAPETAEAGLFQTSWNIKSASPQIPNLFNNYWDDPNGFVDVFNEGLSPRGQDLENYGRGTQGTQYQFLAKICPAFAVLSTAIGLRMRRNHWGPINRHEVELVESADTLLRDVQKLAVP
jgi:uncharacterized protein (TIGR02594 family)